MTRPSNGTVWRVAACVAGLFLTAGGLIAGVAKVTGSQFSQVHTDISALRERTAKVEVLQPVIVHSLEKLETKVDLILTRLPK